MLPACIVALKDAEYKSEFRCTKGTPYLALIIRLMAKIWGIFHEDFFQRINSNIIAPHCILSWGRMYISYLEIQYRKRVIVVHFELQLCHHLCVCPSVPSVRAMSQIVILNKNSQTARILTLNTKGQPGSQRPRSFHICMYVTINLIILIMFDLTNTRPKMVNKSEYGWKLIVHFS